MLGRWLAAPKPPKCDSMVGVDSQADVANSLLPTTYPLPNVRRRGSSLVKRLSNVDVRVAGGLVAPHDLRLAV